MAVAVARPPLWQGLWLAPRRPGESGAGLAIAAERLPLVGEHLPPLPASCVLQCLPQDCPLQARSTSKTSLFWSHTLSFFCTVRWLLAVALCRVGQVQCKHKSVCWQQTDYYMGQLQQNAVPPLV